MFLPLPCYSGSKKKSPVSCSLHLQKLRLPVVSAALGMPEVGKTLPFSCPIFAYQPSLVIAHYWWTGMMVGWGRFALMVRRAAADTDYSHGTRWFQEGKIGGIAVEGGGLPLSAGISRLCILDKVTMSANSSSCTLSLNRVRPLTICKLGSTIFRTST